MPAGSMRERVTIQQEVDVADGLGGSIRSWQPLATVWARVSPLKGQEQVQAQQLEASTLLRITVRYRSDLTEKMRLVWKNKPLNIRSIINPDERKKYLQIMAELGKVT